MQDNSVPLIMRNSQNVVIPPSSNLGLLNCERVYHKEVVAVGSAPRVSGKLMIL